MDYPIARFTSQQLEQTIEDFRNVMQFLNLGGEKLDRLCDRVRPEYSNRSSNEDEEWAFLSTLEIVMQKLVQHRDHPSLHELKAHLERLSIDTPPLGVYEPIPDDHSYLLELITALCAMTVSNRVEVADPNNPGSKKNADIIFEFEGTDCAIECKTIYGGNPQTLLERILDAKLQLKDSHWRDNRPARFGMLTIGLMNVYAKEHNRIHDLDGNDENALSSVTAEMKRFGASRFQPLEAELIQLSKDLAAEPNPTAIFSPVILIYQHLVCRKEENNIPTFMRAFNPALLPRQLPGFAHGDLLARTLNAALQPGSTSPL